MNKLKISAFSLITVSILKIGILFPFGELNEEIRNMEVRYQEMRNQSERIATFEDSLIYNPEFRSRTLGTKFTKSELDSAIANNRLITEQTIEKLEILYEDRIKLGRSFKILNLIDQLLELLFLVSGGLLIYYWIRSGH